MPTLSVCQPRPGCRTMFRRGHSHTLQKIPADAVVDEILDGAGDHVGARISNPDALGLIDSHSQNIAARFLRE